MQVQTPTQHPTEPSVLDTRITAALKAKQLTPAIAAQLTVDAERTNLMVLEIALAIAAASTERHNVDQLLAMIRSKLSRTVTEVIESDEHRAYRNIPGIEQVGKGGRFSVTFGNIPAKRVSLDNSKFGITSENIAAANMLNGLNVSPDNRRQLIDALLPIVVQEGDGYSLKKYDQDGNIVDLSNENHSRDSLSQITIQRTTKSGEYPAYTKEALALYLEAVIHSEMTPEEKAQFIDQLLTTREFDEDIYYSRPPYAGGGYSNHENGIRITLPTGQSMRVGRDGTLKVDDPTQSYTHHESDGIFVMALVERGRLPAQALNCIYTVSIQSDELYLRNRGGSVYLDLSKPFNKDINFSPFCLSFLLTRDPRITPEDRNRLRQYFGNNIEVSVVPTPEL